MPRTFAETGLEMGPWNGDVLARRVAMQLTFVGGPPRLMARFSDAQGKAVAALEAFEAWLRDEVLPKANGQYAIGARRLPADGFAQVRRSSCRWKKLLVAAQADLARNQAEFRSGRRRKIAAG